MAEVGSVGPFFEIRGGVDANDEFSSVGDDHYPFLGWSIPYHLNCQKVSWNVFIEEVSTLGSLNWVELIEITGLFSYLVNVYPPSRE